MNVSYTLSNPFQLVVAVAVAVAVMIIIIIIIITTIRDNEIDLVEKNSIRVGNLLRSFFGFAQLAVNVPGINQRYDPVQFQSGPVRVVQPEDPGNGTGIGHPRALDDNIIQIAAPFDQGLEGCHERIFDGAANASVGQFDEIREQG